MNTPTKNVPFESVHPFRSVNPFLRNCGDFAVAAQSQPQRDQYMKHRQSRIKPNLQRTNMSVLNVGTEKPKGLPDEAWDDSDENFVKRILRGERRQLVSKFTLSKRTQELFINAKLKADTIRERFKCTQEVVASEQCDQPQSPQQHSQQLQSPIKQSSHQSRLYHTVKRQIKLQKKELSRPPHSDPVKSSPVKQKQKLPSLNPERESPQTAQDVRRNRPLLQPSQKDLANIKAESYLIVEHPSGQVVLAHRSKSAMEIASLTKIMTFYVITKVAQQNRVNPTQERVEVHQWFEEISGTSAQLVQGDIYTLEQLLYGLMLPSGNDAAMCLADWAGKVLSAKIEIADTVKVFVQEMNRVAKQLGLKDTRFGNPHGLPHTQSRSTAADVAKLVSICMGIPLFREIITTKEYKDKINTNYGEQRAIQWENTNKLLRRPGFIGVKTGITVTAGPCLATCYLFRQKTFIVVLLRTNKISRRFKQTRKILYWALKNLFQVTPEQRETLQALRRNRRDFDSDNSQDQQEFIYSKCSSNELARRKKILKYEL